MKALTQQLLDDLAPLQDAYGEGVELLRLDPETGGQYMACATASLLILVADGVVQIGKQLSQDHH